MDPVDKALDGDMVTVVVTDKDGNVGRVLTMRSYANMTIEDARRQPWFAEAHIEEADSQPDVT
jgi:hypothetical protein